MRRSSLRPSSPAASRSPARRPAVAIALALCGVGALAVACDNGRRSDRAVTASTGQGVELRKVASLAPQNEVQVAPSSAPAPARMAADEPAAYALSGSSTGEPAMPKATAVAQSSASAMIIRTGTAGIEVDSLDPAISRVRTLALRVNGYVANTTVQGGREQLRSASLELKVPAERFDDALAGLSPIGKVESVNVNAEDVGEEYVDIQARVENAHRLEARIIDLLANRTGKLQDVLSVEHELARVREEIERYEGRLRYLKSRSAMSTLTIAVHEHAPVIVPVAGDGPMVVAFRQAWSNFVGLAAGFVASLGVLIPLGVLAFLAILAIKRLIPTRPNGGTPPATGVMAGD